MVSPVIANRFAIGRSLGEGAMGQVFQATDSTNQATVALKVIRQPFGSHEKTLLQFKQEFRLMTQLRHPNCCAVYDYGVDDGQPYFTMELVPGAGLDECLPLPSGRVREILGQLLAALGYVHQLGFVHRDIKGANVRVRPDGVVKLMDYGLMEYAGRAVPVSGTLATMAPEVVKRAPVDQRTDLYSLGCLTFELLTGRPPFVYEQPAELLRAHVSERPELPSRFNPGIEADLERVVMKLLAKEPIERFQSASEVLVALGFPASVGIGGQLLASPLLGREAELGALTRDLKHVAQGGAGVAVALCGPPGIGKSRLVEEFRFLVQLEALPCALGSCSEQNAYPYQPFVGLLRGLLPALREHVSADLARCAAVLVKLVPELGVEPAPAIEPPAKEKLRLQDAVVALLEALARRRATVLVLEDWQWADPLSVELLGALWRQAAGAPLLAVVTTRAGEDGEAGLPAGARLVPVGPLDPPCVRRMVASILGTTALNDGLVTKIAAFSEGNPFFVQTLIDHLVQNAVLVNDAGAWNTEVELTPDRLPKNFKGLLIRKLTYLSGDALVLARVAAVMGGRLELEVLQGVSGMSDERLFAALEMGHRMQVFVVDEAGAHRFAQDQLQELLYRQMVSAKRVAYHAALALEIERRMGDRPLADWPIETVITVAEHAIRGARPDRTVVYALEAGTRSIGLFALDTAEHYLTAGIEAVATGTSAGHEARQLAYLHALADVGRIRGTDQEDARQLYQQALAIATRLGDTRRLGELWTSVGKTYLVTGHLAEALPACERGLEASLAAGDRAGAARSLLSSCRILFQQGNIAGAIDHTRRALALAREEDFRSRVGEALAFLGYLYVASRPDQLAEGAGYLRQAIAILTELGDKVALLNAFNLLGNAQIIQGDFLAAAESFRENQRLAHEMNNGDEAVYARLNLAVVGLEVGDFAEALDHAHGAADDALVSGNQFQLGLAWILEGTAASYVGRFDQANSPLQLAFELARDLNNTYMETLVMQYRVEMFLVMGQLREAREAGENLLALVKQTGNNEPIGRLKAFMAEIVGRQGELGAAQAFVDDALADATTAGARGIRLRALKVSAWLALQRAEYALARDTALDALVLARAIGARYLEAELLGLLGEIALVGRQGEALAHFEAMATLASAMGSGLLEAMALFGQAAALARDAGATRLVVRAQGLMRGLMANLDAGAQASFYGLRERQRVLDGDYIAGFAAPSGPVPNAAPGRPGLNFGGSPGGFGL